MRQVADVDRIRRFMQVFGAAAEVATRVYFTGGATAGVRTAGVVADFVQATREVEGAAEAYLQGVLPAVVVEDKPPAVEDKPYKRTKDKNRHRIEDEVSVHPKALTSEP
jgi:hypothetical protein